MTTSPHPPVCDVCGQPATTEAVDVLRHEVFGAASVEFRPRGPIRYRL